MKQYSILLFPVALFFVFLSCEEAMICDTGSECVVTTPSFAALPNLSFDDWTYYSIGDYYQPVPTSFWCTPNEASSFYDGGPLVERLEGVETYTGSGYAAKLTTRATLPPIDVLVPIAGSVIASGIFTTDLTSPFNSLIFGRPFNKRIARLTGYYKYFPSGSDACGMYVILRKCRQMTDECGNTYTKREVIGYGEFEQAAETADWTQFIISVDFTSDENPDDVVVYFTSSYQSDQGIGGVGSALHLDELVAEYE